MKKLLCVLLFFALVFSFAACKKDTDKNPTSGENTTVAGQTEDTTGGGEIEYVTDENGELVTDANGEPVTKESVVPVTDENGIPLDAITTEPVSLISDDILPTGKPKEVTTNASGRPADSLIDSAMSDILKSDKYSIKFTARLDYEGSRQTIPTSIQVSGKKNLIEMSVPLAGKIGVLNDGKDTYMYLNYMNLGLIKGYMKISGEEAGEYNSLFEFSSFSDTSDMKYVKTSTVTYKGVEYISEEYRSDDTTIRFFFNNGKLKRIEEVGDDGSLSFLENIEITNNFSDSVFKLPAGYKELNLKDLEKFANMF